MKKIYFTLAMLLCLGMARAQVLTDKHIQANEDSKSGNYKDVLSSFFQLAAKDLAGDNKSIEFNSTLFALKAKAHKEETLNYDNYRQYFARNFQFNLKVKLDSIFSYDGFNGGVTYALVNGRDKHVADFANSELHVLFEQLSGELASQIGPLSASHPMGEISSTIQKILSKDPTVAFTPNEAIIRDKMYAATDAKLFTAPVTLKDKTVVKNTPEMVAALHRLRTQYYTDMESKPLWTVAADGTANRDGKFDSAALGSVFLYGNKAGWNEIDVRAKFTYSDSLEVGGLPRTTLNAKAGMNFKIGKKANQKSFFEIKLYGEYNAILKNELPDEARETILANADFRIRIADDLWIPITVKYDTENANFLGFLNVTYNFGGPE